MTTNDTAPNTSTDDGINESTTSLVADANLSELHTNVANELAELQPKIDELEAALEQLHDLKQQKQKLIALKLSLESILNQPTAPVKPYATLPMGNGNSPAPLAAPHRLDDFQLKSFYPDQAITDTEHLLPRKESLNYQLFRAIVYYGGKATTEEIRQYLIDNQITYPTTGQTFDEIGLSQVSSRVNYLIRKGIVQSLGSGRFASNYGWSES